MYFLPDDHSRVILTQIDGVLPSDYINASYIDVSGQLSIVGQTANFDCELNKWVFLLVCVAFHLLTAMIFTSTGL